MTGEHDPLCGAPRHALTYRRFLGYALIAAGGPDHADPPVAARGRHQAEGNILTPLIEKRLIFIPAALILLGIVAIGALFGFAGVIFAAPIVVTLYVAVKQTLREGRARGDIVIGQRPLTTCPASP